MSAKHTILPWKIYRHKDSVIGIGDAIGGGVIDRTGTFWRMGEEAEANAELVVRAVNAWYDVNALRTRILELELSK